MDNAHDQSSEFESVRAAVCDLNGQARGKRMPAHFVTKLIKDGSRMPLSALNVDMWGHDIEDSPLVFATGDQDGALKPTERGPVPMPWLPSSTALLPMWMYDEDGNPFEGDPRHALNAVLDRYHARGWTPVVATELEFYLVDDSGDELTPPNDPRSGKKALGGEVLSLGELDAYDAFFTDVYAACEAMGIPAETAISEGGKGQFEINLTHSNDALKAADDAWFFKMLVRGIARRHGFAATFMAKPYKSGAGNGMHTHFSVLDDQGRNIFDDGGTQGSELLRSAIAGCLDLMTASTLVFAPHGNSYERFEPGSHAPTGISWAYENRTTAIRVPGGPNAARRIEHRVAGGDVNPYLMLAVVLGAAFIGMEDHMTPPAPLVGSAYDADLEQLPTSWPNAIAAFEKSEKMRRVLPDLLIRNLVMTKKQEAQEYPILSEQEQTTLYLETV